jgi:hypothetical protein
MIRTTPFVKRMRTTGGTIYTFSSALEDIGLNINERNNIVKMSHYALLNIPSIDAPVTLQENKFNVYSIPGAFTYFNNGDIKDGRVVVAESFQNYALNLENNILAQDTYNPALTNTVSERVLWKWLKETGAIRWSPINTSIGLYWKEEYDDPDSSLGYNSIVKAIGNISAGAVRTDSFGTYNETYVLVPTSFGETQVYFKQVEDDNYKHGMSITNGFIPILGRENYLQPHPDALDINSYYDYMDSSTKIANNNITYDASGIVGTGWWWTYEGLNTSEDRNYYTDTSTYINTGIYNIDLSINGQFGYKRSLVDCVGIEFDLTNLRNMNVWGDTLSTDSTLTYDKMAMEYAVNDSYDFNAILIYYSIYNKTADVVLATNLLGILFLDPPSGNTSNFPLSEIKLPSITKLQSGPSGFGTSYSFRLNIKSDYMLDDTAATIFDAAVPYDEDLSNWSDVFDNLGKTLSILNSQTGTLSYITNQYLQLQNDVTNIANQVNNVYNIYNSSNGYGTQGIQGIQGTGGNGVFNIIGNTSEVLFRDDKVKFGYNTSPNFIWDNSILQISGYKSFRYIDSSIYDYNEKVMTSDVSGNASWSSLYDIGNMFPVIMVKDASEFISAFNNYNSENGIKANKGALIIINGNVNIIGDVSLNHSGIIVEGVGNSMIDVSNGKINVWGNKAKIDYRNITIKGKSSTNATLIFDVYSNVDTMFNNVTFDGICYNNISPGVSNSSNCNIYYQTLNINPNINFKLCKFKSDNITKYHRFILYSSAIPTILTASVISHTPNNAIILSHSDRYFDFAISCDNFNYFSDGSGELYNLSPLTGSISQNIKNITIPEIDHNPIGINVPTMKHAFYCDSSNSQLYFSTGVNSNSQWININSSTGVQGIQGIQGLLGNQGIQGISGSAVAQGIQGIQGIQGLLGNQGIQGISGSAVAQGIQGIQGIQGSSIDIYDHWNAKINSKAERGIYKFDSSTGYRGVNFEAGHNISILESSDVSNYYKIIINASNGTGTPYVLPKWSPIGNALIDSSIYSNNIHTGIGTSLPTRNLDINGNIRIRTLDVINSSIYEWALVSDASGNIDKVLRSSVIGDFTFIPNYYVTNLTEFIDAYNKIDIDRKLNGNGGNIYINGRIILTSNLILNMNGIDIYSSGNGGSFMFCNSDSSLATVYKLIINEGNPTFYNTGFIGATTQSSTQMQYLINRNIIDVSCLSSKISFSECEFSNIIGGIEGPVITYSTNPLNEFYSNSLYFNNCIISSNNNIIPFEYSGFHIRYDGAGVNKFRLNLYISDQIYTSGSTTGGFPTNNSGNKYVVTYLNNDFSNFSFFTDDTAWLDRTTTSVGTIPATSRSKLMNSMTYMETITTLNSSDYFLISSSDNKYRKISSEDILSKSSLATIDVKTSNYSLVNEDNGKIIEFNISTDCSIYYHQELVKDFKLQLLK